MKTKFFFTVILLFLLQGILFSQESQNKSGLNNYFWNINFTYGIAGLKSNLDAGAGDNYSIEASCISPQNLGLFAVYSAFGFGPAKINEGTEDIKIKEAASGLKYYISGRNFLSIGFGFYVVQDHKDEYSGLNKSFEQFFGINLGAGANIKITESYGIIFKGKFVNTFSQNETFTFGGISTGIEFNSLEKIIPKSSKEKFSSGIIAGSVKNSYYEHSHKFAFENTSSGSYGMEMTYKASDKISLIANYLHLNSKYSDGWGTFYSVLQNDFAAGVRIYSGSGVLKLFAESLIDLRHQRENLNSMFTTNDFDVLKNSLGIGIGGGAELELFDNFSGLLKVNVFKFDEPGSTTGIFGGINLVI